MTKVNILQRRHCHGGDLNDEADVVEAYCGISCSNVTETARVLYKFNNPTFKKVRLLARGGTWKTKPMLLRRSDANIPSEACSTAMSIPHVSGVSQR